MKAKTVNENLNVENWENRQELEVKYGLKDLEDTFGENILVHELPFEDFNGDVEGLRSHLQKHGLEIDYHEDVTYDGERVTSDLAADVKGPLAGFLTLDYAGYASQEGLDAMFDIYGVEEI